MGRARPRERDLPSLHARQERAGHGARGDRIEAVREGGEAQTVETAAVAAEIAAAAFGAGRRGVFRRIGRGDAHAIDVVVENQIPAGPAHAPGTGDVLLVETIAARPSGVVAVHVGGEGHGVSGIVFRHVFDACEHPVVQVAVEVVALVPGDFAYDTDQLRAHLGVSLVAAAFLPLAESVGMNVIHRVFDPAGVDAVVEVVQRLVENRLVVAQDSDGHHRGQVRQGPVRPVVAPAGADEIVEEPGVVKVELVPHVLLKGGEIRRIPAAVTAHQLPRAGERIAIEARAQGDVRVAVPGGVRGGPGVHDPNRLVRVDRVPRAVVAQRGLIRAVGIARQIHVGVSAVARIDEDGGHGLGAAHVKPFVAHEDVPAAFPRLLARGDLGRHAVQIRLRGQGSRVDELRSRERREHQAQTDEERLGKGDPEEWRREACQWRADAVHLR